MGSSGVLIYNLFSFSSPPNYKCVKSFPSTSAKPVSKSVTPAGNFSASSTESSPTVKCPPIRLSALATMLSTPSSPRLVPASTFPVASSSISNPPLSMKSALAPTANCSTPSNSSPARRTPPTTPPVVTTPSVRRSLTCASTASVSSPISALVSRVSSSSTLLVAVPVPVSDPSSLSVFPSITARSPSLVSPSTPPPRSQPPSLSPTTPCSPLTPSLSTPMSPLCSTTRPSTISAAAISISSAPPTPTRTVS